MNPNDPGQAMTEAQLRAEIEEILERYYRLLSVLRDKEYRKGATMRWLFAFTLSVLLGGLLCIAIGYGPYGEKDHLSVYWPVPAFVIWAGVIGASVSALARVATAPSKGDEETLTVQFQHAMKGVYIAPLLGAVFSIVLYVGFCGHLVEGQFLPEILATGQVVYLPDYDGPPLRTAVPAPSTGKRGVTPAAPPQKPEQSGHPQTTVKNPPADAKDPASKTAPPTNAPIRTERGERERTKQYVWSMMPASSRDFCLLIFWAFIAGYSERFVPDMLDKIASKKKK